MCSGDYGKHEPPVGCAKAGRYPGRDLRYDGGHDDASDPYQLNDLRSRECGNGNKDKGIHDRGDPPQAANGLDDSPDAAEEKNALWDHVGEDGCGPYGQEDPDTRGSSVGPQEKGGCNDVFADDDPPAPQMN